MKKHLFRPFALTGGVLIVWLLATSINIPLAQGSSQTSSSLTTTDLTQGSVVKAGFNGGEKKVFHLQLPANQYLNLTADQQGIDVVVRLKDSDGKVLVEVDSPNSTNGPEELWFVSDTADTYQIEVESPDPNVASGQVELTVKTVRNTTATDRVEAEINQSFSQIQVLSPSNRIPDALKMAETAIKRGEAALPADHQLLALAYQELGNLHRIMGKPREAKTATLKALARFEKTLGPTYEDLVVPLNLLGLLADRAGNFAKAGNMLIAGAGDYRPQPKCSVVENTWFSVWL